MDWRELLSSLQDKLTPDEKEYLAAHRLQDILADETRFCDDPATARLICKQVIHREILQAIQLTQKCPGALTSYLYASGYAYVTQALLGLPSRGPKGTLPTAFGKVSFPTETGRALVFTLYKNGTPLLFRDDLGNWYSWTHRHQPVPCGTRHVIHPSDSVTLTTINVDVATLEACYENGIKHHEDWPAFRHARMQDTLHKNRRRWKECNSQRAAVLRRLGDELTKYDRDILDRLQLDAYLAALVQKHKESPECERYAKYRQSLDQLLASIILFTQTVPGAFTTYIILQANNQINNLESSMGKVRTVFKWAYYRLADMAYEAGHRLRFCLRYRGMPVLFLGAAGQWYSIAEAVEPQLLGGSLVYRVRITTDSRKSIQLSKSVVDLCYRHGHDEYTTWKEIKKGGCLDELD